MKTIPKIFEMLADVPRKEFDPNSITTAEIAAEVGCSIATAGKLVIKKVNSGEWERVFKKVEGNFKPVPSYRLKKKARK